MKRLADRIGKLWCFYMHSAVMWPFRGHYQCRVCRREYPVCFEAAIGAKPERPGSTFAEAVALVKA